MSGTLYWSGFEPLDWMNGVDRSFDLTLSNGVDDDLNLAIQLSLRQLSPAPLIVLNDGEAGATAVEVDGDEGPWDWSDFEDGLAASVLNAPDAPGSATLAISWDAGGLVDNETGIGSIGVRRSDGSNTYSVINLPIEIERFICCIARVGDANNSGADEPTIGDVSTLIDALFISSDLALLVCLAEADINQSGGASPTTADITIGDVSYLIDYLFIGGTSIGLPNCL